MVRPFTSLQREAVDRRYSEFIYGNDQRKAIFKIEIFSVGGSRPDLTGFIKVWRIQLKPTVEEAELIHHVSWTPYDKEFDDESEDA